ncbi:MAG: hypothetical protein R3B90_08160 [Planctomycetaceae bacterium]
MMDDVMRWLLVSQAVSTLLMVGLIWFVQVVHYPLFDAVGRDRFADYERRHTLRTTWVVGPPMLIEAVSATLLCWLKPAGLSDWSVWAGLAMLALIWLSTAVVQVPCHSRLERGFDEVAYRRLVRTNWLRTVLWSARGGLASWMLVTGLD